MKSSVALAVLAFLVCSDALAVPASISSSASDVFTAKKFGPKIYEKLTSDSQTALTGYDGIYKDANEKFLKLEEVSQGKEGILTIIKDIRSQMGTASKLYAQVVRDSSTTALKSFDDLLVLLKDENGAEAVAVKTLIATGSPFANGMEKLTCVSTKKEVQDNEVEKCKTITTRCRSPAMVLAKKEC